MAAPSIGKIKTNGNRLYEVFWDSQRGDIYVRRVSGNLLGEAKLFVAKASSASDAMRKAEAFLYTR